MLLVENDEANINHISKTISRSKRITAHTDYGVGALIGSIGLYFQVMELANIKNQRCEDSYMRVVLTAKLVTSYGAIILQSTEQLMEAVHTLTTKVLLCISLTVKHYKLVGVKEVIRFYLFYGCFNQLNSFKTDFLWIS